MEGEENNQGSDRHRGRLCALPPSDGEVTQQGKTRIRGGRLVMEKVLHMGWRKKKIKKMIHTCRKDSVVSTKKKTSKRLQREFE